jgi:hypothetical protein
MRYDLACGKKERCAASRLGATAPRRLCAVPAEALAEANCRERQTNPLMGNVKMARPRLGVQDQPTRSVDKLIAQNAPPPRRRWQSQLP